MGFRSPQSTFLVSHARALPSINTVSLSRHYDNAQLFEHFIKKIHLMFVYCWVRKALWKLQVHDRKARNSLLLLFLFHISCSSFFPRVFRIHSMMQWTQYSILTFGLHVSADFNYSCVLQGYVKVTVMVLGPGDEAPVSFGSLLRFVFVFVCE